MILLGLLLSGLSLSTALRHRRQRSRRQQAFQEAATACGLQVVTIFCAADDPQVLARAGPLQVRIDDFPPAGTEVVVVTPGPPGFYGVRIRDELYQSLWAREIEVGDEAFDSKFFIEGPIQLIYALLDAEVRHLLIRVNAESRLEIVCGEIRAKLHESQITYILPLLLDLGRRFAQPLSAAQRLAENARQDPVATVRLRNLLLLVREHPGDPGTVETLRAACSDARPEIRLRAAQELGAEGRDVLLEMAESELEDKWNAQAISILGRDLPLDRATTLLNAALSRHRILTACACLEVLGTSGGAPEVDVLAKVLVLEHGELAVAAALALGRTGSTAAEPPLILALEHESAEVLVAAANALAEVGTAAAVLPLKEAAGRIAHHRELHRAARQAIAAIQSRLPEASPGQLSLAAAAAGQLSLAPAEAGQLSLASHPSGQLSLPD